MDKIASSTELQGELQRILRLAREPNPSRERLASELQSLAYRVAGKMPEDAWTQKGDQWGAKAQYAGGEKHTWAVKEVGGKFTLHVKIDESGLSYKCKKNFDSLEQAQKYAWKFIDKADGNKKLEPVLDKDFTAQK
jgi:hypothetical protein